MDVSHGLRAVAESQLQDLIRAAGIEPSAAYRPGEVCRLLRISPTTLRGLCELAEHPDIPNRDSRALESFRIGVHYRITHTALAEWLARNQTFQRLE